MIPLLSRWRIRAASLPDEMLDAPKRPSFTLPGAGALLDFSDLIGDDGGGAPALPDKEEIDEAPFSLPAMIPEDVPGEVSLVQEIDFGAIEGDRALLSLDHLTGSGEILLGEKRLAAFSDTRPADGALTVDLTDALRRGRKETLCIRFGDARPAGVPAPVTLRVCRHAHIASLTLHPAPARQTVSVCAKICAIAAGDYLLRARVCPADPENAPSAAREVSFSLAADGEHEICFSMEMPGKRFAPGEPFAAPSVRTELIRLFPGQRMRHESLCDHLTLLCGYHGPAPLTYVPLTPQECAQDVRVLAARLREHHIFCVSLDFPAGESFYREMTHAGIAVRQYLPQDHPLQDRLRRFPCVTLESAPSVSVRTPAPDALSAWQLCGVSGMQRTADPDLTPADLLFDAAGMPLNPADESVRGVLSWLRAVLVRLRAEAARQSRYTGALCAPGEWTQSDISDAFQAALRPMHLSALPLLGAWGTGMRFSASLYACIPEPAHSLSAFASLEDENGEELARFTAPVGERGGYAGVFECTLPDHPCALTLCVRLTQGVNRILLEEYTLPVYVGERGALEAAFR